MADLDLVLNPINKRTIGGRAMRVFVHIKFKDGKLSITGVEGPMSNEDCLGSCGQIDMTLREDNHADWTFQPGWNLTKMARLLEIWDRWHLNDMQAGTPAQMEFVRKWLKENFPNGYTGGESLYDQQCDALRAAGLYEDGGYKYGTAWLREDVPDEVIQWLAALPVSRVTPAWC